MLSCLTAILSMSVPPPPSALPPSASSSFASDSAATGDESGGKKSSYYFFKSTPAHEAQKYMPTLLTPAGTGVAASSPSPVQSPSPSPSQSPEPAASVSSVAGGSRWNAAGTWEERDMSSWAHSRLTALLAFNSGALAVSCTKVTGDATLVFTRGKKRVGFDLAVQCEWRGRLDGGSGGDEVRGGIELPSVDQTSEGEYEMTVTVKERGAADDEAVDQLTRAAKKLKATITSKIKQFEQELQEQ